MFQVGERRKIHNCTWPWAASNLQPSSLCSNANRSLPGNQDVFFLIFSSIYIHIGTLVSNSLPLGITDGTKWTKTALVITKRSIGSQYGITT